MNNKVILPMLLGILIIGITQLASAEESEKVNFISVSAEEFDQPKSKYNYQEIIIIGYVEDYNRGQKVTVTITNPDSSEEEINTFASKRGEVYTLLHLTSDAQVGVHQLSMIYEGTEIASTSFEILNNQ